MADKCELCGRRKGIETDDVKPIEVGGNTFEACDTCFPYLSTPYTIDVAERRIDLG